MKSPSHRLLIGLTALATPALLVAQTERTAPDAAFNWTAANAWSGSTWVSGDDALFNVNTGSTGRTATVNADTTARNITFNHAANTWTIGGTSTLTLTGTLEKTNTGVGRIIAPLAGSGAINILQGELRFETTNQTNFSGPITLNGGLLSFGTNATNPIGTGTLTIQSGTLSYFNNGTRTLPNAITIAGNFSYSPGSTNGASNTTQLSGTADLGSTTRTIEVQLGNATTSTLAFTNTVSGSGGITKTGAGTLRLAGNNTFSGLVTVNAGAVDLNATSGNNALPGNIVINSGGSLLLSTSNNIADTSTVTMNAGSTFTFNGSVTTTTGNVAVRSDRIGALVFNGGSFTNTSAVIGTTTGTLGSTGGGGLALGGSGSVTAGRLTIDSGGILSGNGTGLLISSNDGANSLTVLNAGGRIRPGSLGNDNIGTLGIATTQGFTWNGETTATAQMQFNLGAANSSDRLDLTGVLTKGTGSNFIFDFLGGGVEGGVYSLMSFASTTFSVGDFGFTNLGAGLAVRDGDGWTNGFRLNSGSLEFGIIPEPSAFAAFAGLSALGCAAMRRRRVA